MAILNKHFDIDFYALLGVTRGSSIHAIKSAFRKMSMKAHPDRGGSNEAQAKINYAYEILSDPIRRKQYDEILVKWAVHAPEKPRYRSKHSEEWEKSFRKSREKKNIRDRVREAVERRSEEIRTGFSSRLDAQYAEACRSFRKTRGRFCIFASALIIFFAAGFLYPVLWPGVLFSGYAMARNFRYGDGEYAVFVLNPEWKYILKRQARKRARLETDALRDHLDNISDRVTQLISAVRKSSGIRDNERTILRRILMHFFLLGYMPVSRDEGTRMVLLSNGVEQIAFRYRHRSGSPINAAFIKKAYEYMDANKIRKGFLYAAPGLSRNAAKFADDHAIVHYSIREMNAWINRMTASHYPGPDGDIIEHIAAFMKFTQRI